VLKSEIDSQLWKTSDTEVDTNRVWKTIRENISISTKESVGYYELKKHKAMVRQRMLRIIGIKQTSQISVVIGPKRNKWG
jgi:hypothetical protein